MGCPLLACFSTLLTQGLRLLRPWTWLGTALDPEETSRQTCHTGQEATLLPGAYETAGLRALSSLPSACLLSVDKLQPKNKFHQKSENVQKHRKIVKGGQIIIIKLLGIVKDLQLLLKGFPGDASGKESSCQCRRCKRQGFDPWLWKIPWSRKWQPTPVSLPGKSHGQRSLVGYSPWGRKESDVTQRLSKRGYREYSGSPCELSYRY